MFERRFAKRLGLGLVVAIVSTALYGITAANASDAMHCPSGMKVVLSDPVYVGAEKVGSIEILKNAKQVCAFVKRAGDASAVEGYTSIWLRGTTTDTNTRVTSQTTFVALVNSTGCVDASTRISYGSTSVVWGNKGGKYLCGGTGGGTVTGGAAPTPAKAGNATTTELKAVAFAKTQLGVPYAYGGKRPTAVSGGGSTPKSRSDRGGFDCSGLVMWSYSQAGVIIPRTSQAQATKGKKVSKPGPGDLVFRKDLGHVGIVIDSTHAIHAPQTGGVVEIVPLSHFGSGAIYRSLQ